MPTCAVDGVKLNYKIGGPADGNTLVMLHGWTASHQLFEFAGLFDALAAHLRVLTYDQRGHGDSDKPEESYGLERFTDDLKGLLDGLGIRRPVILLGQSMGGCIAANFARKYPEAVKGLILMNTTLYLLTDEQAKAGWHAVIEGQKADRRGTMRQVIRQMFWKPPEPGMVEEQLAMSLKTPLPLAIKAFEGVLTGNVAQHAGAIRAPTLILHGEHDIAPLSHAEAAHRAILGSKLVVMKDCGHLPSVEMPQETQRVLLDFAATL